MQRGLKIVGGGGSQRKWGRGRAGKLSGSKGAEVEGERTILLPVTMNMRTKEGKKDGKKKNRTCHHIHEKEEGKRESRKEREKVARKERKS